MTALPPHLDAVRQRIDAAKKNAKFFMARRRRDGKLYQLLAETLAICEYVAANDLLEAVRAEIAAKDRNGRNRTYAEKNSDLYLVVGRSVFEPEMNREGSWRYSVTLREAARRQIRSGDLAAWLSENGGVNTLFKGRGVLASASTTKTLHLNQPVEVRQGVDITLRLRMDHRGFFNVIATEADGRAAA
ncbi:hypothetical protein [Notoacmeibacter sp. MSK16QG-6]|uniref:hypothetical protein n=1 Tax=Notoacmeibacter sp. MSK16QG-6 TaxID=2957982 RepID=UPI00209FE128|nr:hypothetical protein [Notoacmeibacter sp. MSK16QG-6]MCP1200096.1 hypothetical protein [Notoacmeibacter sp. MSK16QG-6]